MTDTALLNNGASPLLIYTAADGRVQIAAQVSAETLWLTQQQMAELFQTTKQNISLHLKNMLDEGELLEDSVVKDFLTTAADGKNYRTKHYNLDAVLSVGYRVKSTVATRFRIWAITGQTAAEIIHSRAYKNKAHMGLTNWRGSAVRKSSTRHSTSHASKPRMHRKATLTAW